MSGDKAPGLDKANQPETAGPAGAIDSKQKALAAALEFSKRLFDVESLDELLFALTNDLRVLIPFDRAILITHFRGQSEFVAATNQPALKTKFRFSQNVTELAGRIKDADVAVLLTNQSDSDTLADQKISPEAREALLGYIKDSGCSLVLLMPLKHNNALIGHEILEFHGANQPSQLELLAVLSVAPFFAAALSERWMMNEYPERSAPLAPPESVSSVAARYRKNPYILTAVALCCIAVLFLIPISATVGGDCDVFAKERWLAFVKIDGLIDRIFVKEGSKVKEGDILALLDRRDLDHEIKAAERKLEVLTSEMNLLRRESGQDPSKLAESKLVDLKRTSAAEELEYLKWKTNFLEVRAPASAIVVTKEVDSLVGKKFRAGEPFCELAAPGDLWVSILAPEDKISLIKPGQTTSVYLNTEPYRRFELKVAEIAPIAQVQPRQGNVYRVMAPFKNAPDYAKVGMKGIGKIETETTNVFNIIYQRILTRWNHLSIYL
jgi:hypothetical protein